MYNIAVGALYGASVYNARLGNPSAAGAGCDRIIRAHTHMHMHTHTHHEQHRCISTRRRQNVRYIICIIGT